MAWLSVVFLFILFYITCHHKRRGGWRGRGRRSLPHLPVCLSVQAGGKGGGGFGPVLMRDIMNGPNEGAAIFLDNGEYSGVFHYY